MKKKVFALVLCVALLAVAIVGGTLAYFTDSKAQTNTFTAGNVAIKLDEAKVKDDDKGNLVADGTNRTTEAQTYKLYPGMTVAKDPTITVTGSEDAYVAAKITVTGDKGLYELYKQDGNSEWKGLDVNKMLSGGLIGATGTTTGWNGLYGFESDASFVYQDASGADNGVWVIYVFMKNAVEKDGKVVLFTTLTVDEDYDNEEMEILNDATVKVEAYAAQEHGFDSCFEAMTKAFPTDFPFATNP